MTNLCWRVSRPNFDGESASDANGNRTLAAEMAVVWARANPRI
jgi:hypothetical protein